MENMSKENKENLRKGKQPISDLLMKPFTLGWTREVVRRAVTHSGTPNCDIYYFNPNKKKLRSLIEVKSNLTDGLSLECFSFKKEPLGLSPKLETVRDAKARGRGGEKSKEKRKGTREVKKPENSKTGEKDVNEAVKKSKTKKGDSDSPKEKEDSKPNDEGMETDVKVDENKTEEEDEEEEKKENKKKEKTENIEEKGEDEETKEKKMDPVACSNCDDEEESKESKTNISKSRRKKKSAAVTKPVKLQSARKRKTALEVVMSVKQAKQAKVVPNKKKLKTIVRKKVASTSKTLRKTQREKKVKLKPKKNSSQKVKKGKTPTKANLTKTKSEASRVQETKESDDKSLAARDLKSIVKKNIGKYREMREKQKLGAAKSQSRNASKKLSIAHLPRSRSEPISKNKPFYLKPLEKGWRRELVYRTNCAKAGQKADVYYFHPNGKKLRSCREIAENLTQGLSIECFTFRKEPLGCGEPSEVIRNARSFQKKN